MAPACAHLVHPDPVAGMLAAAADPLILHKLSIDDPRQRHRPLRRQHRGLCVVGDEHRRVRLVVLRDSDPSEGRHLADHPMLRFL
jgi:hypothetical protein